MEPSGVGEQVDTKWLSWELHKAEREHLRRDTETQTEYDQQMALCVCMRVCECVCVHTHMHTYFMHTEVTKVRTAPRIILATYLKGGC